MGRVLSMSACRIEPKDLKRYGVRDYVEDGFAASVRGTLRKRFASSGSGRLIDLRMFSSPRHDQEHSSSCTAQGVVKGAEIKRIQELGHDAHIDLSRRMAYYLGRSLLGAKAIIDDGCYISYVAEALRVWGVCKEITFPWQLGKTDRGTLCINQKPTWMAMREGYLGKVSGVFKIRSFKEKLVEDIIDNLDIGNPVVYGTTVGRNWEEYGPGSAPLGIVPNVLGRHVTVLVGWDPKDETLLGENSWGTTWGIAPVREHEDWNRPGIPSYTMEGGYYKIRPEVIMHKDSADFTVMVRGWEPWVKEAS